MKEIWKDIPGFEGLYIASDHGKIMALPRQIFKSTGSHFQRSRILKGSLNRKTKRYPMVNLTDRNGKHENLLVHRLVALTFLSNPENKRTVNHKDLDKTNNHLSNLEWATDAENLDHARNLGAMDNGAKGERVKRAVLTDDQVKQVKQMMRDGETNSYIRRAFRVNRSMISHIRNGRTWKHITL